MMTTRESHAAWLETIAKLLLKMADEPQPPQRDLAAAAKRLSEASAYLRMEQDAIDLLTGADDL